MTSLHSPEVPPKILARLVADDLANYNQKVADQLVEHHRILAAELVESNRLVATTLAQSTQQVADSLVLSNQQVAAQLIEQTRVVATMQKRWNWSIILINGMIGVIMVAFAMSFLKSALTSLP